MILPYAKISFYVNRQPTAVINHITADRHFGQMLDAYYKEYVKKNDDEYLMMLRHVKEHQRCFIECFLRTLGIDPDVNWHISYGFDPVYQTHEYNIGLDLKVYRNREMVSATKMSTFQKLLVDRLEPKPEQDTSFVRRNLNRQPHSLLFEDPDTVIDLGIRYFGIVFRSKDGHTHGISPMLYNTDSGLDMKYVACLDMHEQDLIDTYLFLGEKKNPDGKPYRSEQYLQDFANVLVDAGSTHDYTRKYAKIPLRLNRDTSVDDGYPDNLTKIRVRDHQLILHYITEGVRRHIELPFIYGAGLWDIKEDGALYNIVPNIDRFKTFFEIVDSRRYTRQWLKERRNQDLTALHVTDIPVDFHWLISLCLRDTDKYDALCFVYGRHDEDRRWLKHLGFLIKTGAPRYTYEPNYARIDAYLEHVESSKAKEACEFNFDLSIDDIK